MRNILVLLEGFIEKYPVTKEAFELSASVTKHEDIFAEKKQTLDVSAGRAFLSIKFLLACIGPQV